MRSLLGVAKECPSLAPRQGPARNSLRSLCSLRSDSLAELEGWRACGTRPCLGARAGGAKGAEPQQPNPTAELRAADCRHRADSWICPSAPPGLRPRQGCARKRASITDPGRLFDRSERSERREFLPDPCLGRKPGNPLPPARGERSAGPPFFGFFLWRSKERNSGCRGGQPLRAAPRT
jgi:hypothetical protein